MAEEKERGKEKGREKGKEKGKEKVEDRPVERRRRRRQKNFRLQLNGESRRQMSNLREVSQVKEANYLSKPSIERTSSSMKVLWADEVGGALTQTLSHSKNSAPDTRPIDTSPPQVRRRTDRKRKKPSHPIATGIKKTYKEALLTPTPIPSHHQRRAQSLHLFPATPASISRSGRCFRCLGYDHRASNCRGPIRYLRCYKTGHIARACMEQSLPQCNTGRCTPTKNLGHFPQETIANRLVARFGGFPSDFHVARYSKRDFVIFLPEWVPSHQLLSREIISWRISDSSAFPGIPGAFERWGRRDFVAPGNPLTKGRISTILGREPPTPIAAQVVLFEGAGRQSADLRALMRHGILPKSEIGGGRRTPGGLGSMIVSKGQGPVVEESGLITVSQRGPYNCTGSMGLGPVQDWKVLGSNGGVKQPGSHGPRPITGSLQRPDIYNGPNDGGEGSGPDVVNGGAHIITGPPGIFNCLILMVRVDDSGRNAKTVPDLYVGGDDLGPEANLPVASPGAASGEDLNNPFIVPLPDVEEGLPSCEWRRPTRSSARLKSSASDSALERAKRRKAILLEGEISSSRTLARKWNSKKVLAKSARCGVKLTVTDAEELHKFLLRG
uniref:CCHC-type domain-containing protein n=1 Tax=Ananas comosus var. bracteatus TaxID=296719 RepID=A0A6V7PJZ7_ANACO|nr:unnamed protein product [Ananas comosus var. bracteatus]